MREPNGIFPDRFLKNTNVDPHRPLSVAPAQKLRCPHEEIISESFEAFVKALALKSKLKQQCDMKVLSCPLGCAGAHFRLDLVKLIFPLVSFWLLLRFPRGLQKLVKGQVFSRTSVATHYTVQIKSLKLGLFSRRFLVQGSDLSVKKTR